MDKTTKYLIEFKNQNASAVFEYNKDGYLVSYQLNQGMFQYEHFNYLLKIFPLNEVGMIAWMSLKLKNVRIKEVEPDLSFQAFYDRYAYKVSKRKTAERIWKKMDDINKARAIAYIPQYESHLIKTGINKKYPETYLNQEIWNN